MYRTRYLQTNPIRGDDNLDVSLLRGWCLLPITFYSFIFILSTTSTTSIVSDFIFLLHLLVATCYHLSPIKKLELILWRADRCLILFCCGVSLTDVFIYIGIPYCWWFIFFVSFLSCLTHNDKINIISHIFVSTVGLSVLTYQMIYSQLHRDYIIDVFINLILSILSSGFYIIENLNVKGVRREGLLIISPHDVCHVTISFVYLHRLWVIRHTLFDKNFILTNSSK
jgi:hypothetical protein